MELLMALGALGLIEYLGEYSGATDPEAGNDRNEDESLSSCVFSPQDEISVGSLVVHSVHSGNNEAAMTMLARKVLYRECANGDIFSGYIDGITGELIHGKRKCVLSGEVYEGPFLNGVRHGENAICTTRITGSKFLGSFRNDEPFQGTLTTPEFTYWGTFYLQRMLRQGGAKLKTAHRHIHQKTYIFHGKGTLIHKDGKTYVGEFSQGVYHGAGKETKSDGSFYTGDYKRGKRDGIGTLFSSDGKLVYSGIWTRGERERKANVIVQGEMDTGERFLTLKNENLQSKAAQNHKDVSP
eukprot:CAMPEP_0195520128 /NCGR_PEP_ID=MMETSP0794_2-20130614/16196_1 /TAXON_ID=515487 /ORGANISM="Stephanopyxis turris, Strain CCMP 815" /LENGTH=296 /DNA_ID=CAMNT_0040649415 /DNA_START=11 /DNA_END=901 /DNA_ORIENTATION=-